MVRFKWLDSDDESYFEFKIDMDSITNDVILIITDFSESEEEKEHEINLWNTQVQALMKSIGSKELKIYFEKLNKSITIAFINYFYTFSIVIFILLMQFLWKYIDDLIGKGLDTNLIFELLYTLLAH